MCTIGNLFHVKHRSRDGMVDEDALLQFVDISTQGASKSDQILMLSSPLDDIIQHAWKTSQIQQFRITDLGISIEFCATCYKTHIPQHRSFNMFVHTSVLNDCVDFICNKIQAVASDVPFNNFITIYRIEDHHCPPPITPPPPAPSNIDVQPLMSRDHPRFGYLNAPPAKPVPKYANLVSPYKITSKIIINNDGSISQESMILGHNRSISTPNLLKPPRVQKNVQQSTALDMAQTFPQKEVTEQLLCRSTSGNLVSPKHIKRTDVPELVPTHPKVDVSVDDQGDYVKDSLFDGYVDMKSNSNLAKFQPPLSPVVGNVKSSDFLNTKVQRVHPFFLALNNGSHTSSVENDETDRDYINIQNILIKLDKTLPKSQSVSKPPIKTRTIKTEINSTHVDVANQPCIVPRKNSLTSPDSLKPIPRRRTMTSNTFPVQKRFDFSMQLKEKEDVDVTSDVHTNTDVMKLTPELDDESKSRASPVSSVRAVESCDHIFSVDSSDVFTEDDTIQGCPIGLYMLCFQFLKSSYVYVLLKYLYGTILKAQ